MSCRFRTFAAHLKNVTLNNFSELGLSPEILRALEELGYETPSEVQAQSIPILTSEECDFIGLAQTGTGKTAAFGLPLLQGIDRHTKSTQALILSPTRELARQITESLEKYAKYLPEIRIETVYGGDSMSRQIRAVKQLPHIIVATPGRLIDLLGKNVIRPETIYRVVLDEADEMLNMGFKDDIDKILSYTPEDKLTWLFSATMPPEIRRIVKEYMESPKEVMVNRTNTVNENIVHSYALTRSNDKIEAIRRLIDFDDEFYGIAFCRTKVETQALADELSRLGYGAMALNGDMSQNQRESVMKSFKARRIKLLVATDVAARGIDADNLTHVIHHRLPDDAEYYTHRSGRTARAGRTGISLSLISSSEMRKIHFFEKKLKIQFEKHVLPTQSEIGERRLSAWAEKVIGTDTEAGDLPKNGLEKVKAALSELDKDTLIEKMLRMEFADFRFNGPSIDMSSSSRERPSRERGERGERSERGPRDRGERSDRESSKSTTADTFFINLGKMDGLDKAELLHMICEQAGIESKYFGEIRMRDKCTFFEVDKKHAKGVPNKFSGLFYEGRAVRVNLDDDTRDSGKSGVRRKSSFGKRNRG